MIEKPKIVVIVGPTGSGKTALSLEIAKKFGGEIISADSRQVYRKLDIGTAKITQEEMRGVPHHLIDIIDIDTTYTAVHFKKDATKIIKQIQERGNVPIIAGGTFFYIDTLLNRVQTPYVPPNKTLREALEKLDTQTLFTRLQNADPRRAENIDPKNKRRLIRALEIIETLGEVPQTAVADCPYQPLIFGIQISKEELRKKFRERALDWLKIGFITEIRNLLNGGINRKRLAEIGFEYKIGVDFIDGKLTEEKFIDVFEQKNWQYAKRQMMWLKRDKSILWLQPNEKKEMEFIVEQFLRN